MAPPVSDAGQMPASSSGSLPEPPGGHRQRARWAAGPAVHNKSALAEFLIDKWSWGFMSAVLVQQICAAAVADGATHPDVKTLSELGSKGKHQQNIHVELIRKLAPLSVVKCLFQFGVYMKRSGNFIVSTEHFLLLPHELFACIYRDHKEAFLRRIAGGGVDTVKRFWRQMARHPCYAEHPVRGRPDHHERCIPLGLHGDSVPVTGKGKSWAKSLTCWSWNSLLGSGTTIQAHFVIYMYYLRFVVRQANMDLVASFWKRLRWSLYWLAVGRWPARDWEERAWPEGSPQHQKKGSYLADGWYAVLWAIQGDLEHMASAFGLSWPTSAQPCVCCRANSSDTPWTDGRPGVAAWQATVYTNSSWRDHHPHPHPVFTLPGVGIQNYVPDVLHVLHLGVYQYLFGSILKYLTHYALDQRPEQNMDRVWSRIKQAYKEPPGKARQSLNARWFRGAKPNPAFWLCCVCRRIFASRSASATSSCRCSWGKRLTTSHV